jgi:phage terminase large subunit-like protein
VATSRRGGYRFDEEAASRACGFFEDLLIHVKGEWAGRPFVLEKWQREIVRNLFGWKRPDGTRRYRIAYIEVPKKNGKSTLVAGIGLYLLTADGEPGAEVYSAAADREQAAIVFSTARSMVEASPELAAHCETYHRSIVVPRTGSSYKVLSADVPTKHGLNPHGILFDELHAQPNRELWDTLVTGGAARRQPLVVAITTAGFDRKSICYELHEHALKVQDGVIKDDAFLPVIYSAGTEDDWTDPKVWKRANPSLGISVKFDFLSEECERAKENPRKQNSFRRLHLNQWTEQSMRWIDMNVWGECKGDVDPEELAGRTCFAGLDLSRSTDLSAFVLLFPPEEREDESEGAAGQPGPGDQPLARPKREPYKVLAYFWMPEENIAQRVRRDRVPYDLWVRHGVIEATEGNVIDYDVIRKRINELSLRFEIREIAYDRWGATQLSTQLQGEGLMIVPFGQGYASMSPAAKAFEKLLLGRQLAHGGNPVLSWMASNVAIKRDPADNIKPDKAKSSDRIDGIVALVMAVGREMVHIGAGSPQVWVIG